MSESKSLPSSGVLCLGPDEGRRYAMGRLTAVFKADEAETDSRYAVSEWILDTGFNGVGAHSHAENEEIFYVLAGRPEVLVGSQWTALEPGAFLRIPADVMHDFRNRSGEEARLLNLFIPGGFERAMPSIMAWFEANPEKGSA